MDLEDLFSDKPKDPLTELARQDLGPMSVAELDERVAALNAEITRVQTHLADTAEHRALADALFAKR